MPKSQVVSEDDDEDEFDDLDSMSLTDEERAVVREAAAEEAEDDAPEETSGLDEEGEAQDEGDPFPDAEAEAHTDQPNTAVSAEAGDQVTGSVEDERRAAIEAERASLATLYDDGEIDTSEYMDKREALIRQEMALDYELLKAQDDEQARIAEYDRIWKAANAAFFSVNPDYYNVESLRDAMQGKYNKIHNDPAYATSSHAERLAEAKRRVDVEIGRVTTPGGQDAAVRAAMQKRGREASRVQPGLSDVPAADNTTPESGGKYAHIDALEGLAQERAIAKLSESEQEAWLQAQD